MVAEPPARGWVALGAVYTFFKDLGLAALLGLVAFASQHLQQTRNEVRETWNELFPRAHENAVKHLFPVLTSIQAFKREIEDDVAKGHAKPSPLSIYHLLRLFRSWWDNIVEGGGIFFADRRGEDVVGALWSCVRKECDAKLGAMERWALMDRISKSDTLTSFLTKVSEPPLDWDERGQRRVSTYEQVERTLGAWMREPDFRLECELLGVLAAVIQYEVNRLYERWYERSEAPDDTAAAIRTFVADLETVKSPRAEEMKKAVVEVLRSYVDERLGMKAP
jgi:hypothetical protein